jgi:starch-binding outer membrane protein, SusD/RagB family
MRLKLKKINWVSVIALSVIISGAVSCKKFLDVQPEDKLVGEQMYRDVFDADAAVLGVYGKLMNVAKQYIVLNELRADLMSVTVNADPYLREIGTSTVTDGNPYANPKPFYEVILNCNDVLKNFDIMLKDKKFSQDDYNQRYSDVGAIRSWVYLQLGIQFGNVPYITDPLENINDVKDASKFPKVNFDDLLDKLIAFTEALPYKKPYVTGNSLVITVDGYNTAKFFINKECLLGDLNLWKGNYTQAATYYKSVMETGTPSGNDNEKFDTYRVKYAEVTSHNDLAVGYVRFGEQDATSLVNNNTQGWKSMFIRGQDVLWNTEWIWVLPFSKDFKPSNPFIDLFSNRGGSYLVKPSQQAIDMWDAQKQNNGIPYDARGKKFTYNELNGQPVIMKYIYNYLDPVTWQPVNFFEKQGQWFLYRAATLHLRFAEAANRDNRHKLANALLNTGIQNAYTEDGVTDVTNIEQTHDVPPYDFDARMGDYPRFRSPWHRNGGVRGRAYVQPAPVEGDSTISIEDNLIREAGLELAYEGYRWADLVRIAKRRNDPAFLADKIYEKLLKEGNGKAGEVRTRLMNPDNWYLPFRWE